MNDQRNDTDGYNDEAFGRMHAEGLKEWIGF